MGNRISSELQRLLQERKLVRARITRDMVVKEIRAAETDLQDARDSLSRNRFKWATIQGYYAMFHSARALLYHHGFREKSHYAVLVALRSLLASELGQDLISMFEQGMELRQEADYGLRFSEAGAQETAEGAKSFLTKAKEFLRVR